MREKSQMRNVLCKQELKKKIYEVLFYLLGNKKKRKKSCGLSDHTHSQTKIPKNHTYIEQSENVETVFVYYVCKVCGVSFLKHKYSDIWWNTDNTEKRLWIQWNLSTATKASKRLLNKDKHTNPSKFILLDPWYLWATVQTFHFVAQPELCLD